MVITNLKETLSVYDVTQEIGKIYKGTLLVYGGWKDLIANGVPPLTLEKCKGVDLLDYKIYGNSVQSRLPNEYQEVEYIESTGTQYIDTTYIPNSNTKIEMKLSNSSTSDFALYCARGLTYSDNTYTAFLMNGNTLRVDYDSSQYRNLATFINDTEYIYMQDKNFIYLNNELIKTINKPEFSSEYNMTLLASHLGGTNITNMGKVKLYYCKIWDNREILVRDFVPCYRKSDNVIGLYDLVNNVFYTNQGTGTFLKGNDAPTPNAPIEIESVGNKTKNLFSKIDDYIPVLPNVNYHLSSSYRDIATTAVVYMYDKNKNKIQDTKTTPSNGFYFATWQDNGYMTGTSLNKLDNTFNFSNPEVAYITISRTQHENIQFEEGTVTTEYEPYGYEIPVKVSGKNLFDSTVSKYSGYANYTVENNTFYVEAVTDNYISANLPIANQKDLFGKTFTVSAYVKNNTNSKGSIRFGFFNGVSGTSWEYFRSEGIQPNTEKNVTITFKIPETVPENYQLCIALYGNTDTFIGETSGYIEYSNIQLESGDVATEYEPYKEPITTNIYLNEPLRKIGDYADYIDFKNSKVVWNIKRYTFTGSETLNGGNIETSGWGGTNTTGFYQYVNGYSGMYFFGEDYQPLISTIMSDYFVYKEHSYGSDDERMGIASPTAESGYFHFRVNRSLLEQYGSDNSSTTVNQTALKSWLKTMYDNGNPVTVDYVLAKPKEETIELPNIPTLKGTTILSIEDTLNSSYMEAVYKGKGKLQLLDLETNDILNSILSTDTETQKDITDTEIIEILDKIIGG